jgi:hypothetical protein
VIISPASNVETAKQRMELAKKKEIGFVSSSQKVNF